MLYEEGILFSDTFLKVELELDSLAKENFSVKNIQLLHDFIVQNPFISDDEIKHHLISLIYWYNKVGNYKCIAEFKKFTNKDTNKFIRLFEIVDNGNFDSYIKDNYLSLYNLLLKVSFTKTTLINTIDLLSDDFYVIRNYEHLFIDNKGQYVSYFIENVEMCGYPVDSTIGFCNRTLKSISNDLIKNIYKDILSYYELLCL